MIGKSSFWIPLFLIIELGFSMMAYAGKDLAPIHLQANATERTAEYSIAGFKIPEKYWLLNILVRNDGQEPLEFEAYKFKVLASDGSIIITSNIPDIPPKALFPKIVLKSQESASGLLGFKCKPDTYPRQIIYESTFLTATSNINRSGVAIPLTPSKPLEEPNPPNSTRTPMPLSPEQRELLRMRKGAAQEATMARDSVLAESQMDITKKYFRLQDENKQQYSEKKINFDQFILHKKELDDQKQLELKKTEEKAGRLYDEIYSRITADYNRQKKP